MQCSARAALAASIFCGRRHIGSVGTVTGAVGEPSKVISKYVSAEALSACAYERVSFSHCLYFEYVFKFRLVVTGGHRSHRARIYAGRLESA
jgi:hypothetical protein